MHTFPCTAVAHFRLKLDVQGSVWLHFLFSYLSCGVFAFYSLLFSVCYVPCLASWLVKPSPCSVLRGSKICRLPRLERPTILVERRLGDEGNLMLCHNSGV